jgi:hypothetical protein
MVTQEVAPTDTEAHGDQTGDASSSASGEDLSQTPDDASDGSTELLTSIFESNFSNEEESEGHSDESGINFIDLTESHDPVSQDENPVLGEFFTIEVQPEHSDGESTESSDAVGIPEFSENNHNEYLIGEYKAFLGDNPDWIEVHADGDIQAQVITTSEYTSIELENPGAAHSFDQWFHATYIAPYEESTPVEGGTLLVGGPDYSAWTSAAPLELAGSGLINGGVVLEGSVPDFNANPLSGDEHQMVMDQPTGVPEAWMRGGTFELSHQVDEGSLVLSGGSPLPVNGAGVVHTENLNTGHDLPVPALGEASRRRRSAVTRLASAMTPRSASAALAATASRKKATQPSQSPSVRMAESRR